MPWLEITIKDHVDAHKATTVIERHIAKKMEILARNGLLDSAEGFVVWSKLDLQTGITTYLFNGLAAHLFGEVSDVFGAVEASPRIVQIGRGDFGVLFAYGDDRKNEVLVDR